MSGLRCFIIGKMSNLYLVTKNMQETISIRSERNIGCFACEWCIDLPAQLFFAN